MMLSLVSSESHSDLSVSRQVVRHLLMVSNFIIYLHCVQKQQLLRLKFAIKDFFNNQYSIEDAEVAKCLGHKRIPIDYDSRINRILWGISFTVVVDK